MLKFKEHKTEKINPDLLMLKQHGVWVAVFTSPLHIGRNVSYAVTNHMSNLRTYETIEQAITDLTQDLCFPMSKLLSLGVHFVNMYQMAPTPQEFRRLYNPLHLTIFVDWIKRRALRGEFPNIGIEALMNMSINKGASTGVDMT